MFLIQPAFTVNEKAFHVQPGARLIIEKIVLANQAQSHMKGGVTQAVDRAPVPANPLFVQPLPKRLL